MPELDGFELLDLVRTASIERIRKMPVIIVTDATGSSDAKDKAYEMGATDFIAKPFDATDINARASSLLRNQVRSSSRPEGILNDPLTGLLNKRGIFRELETEINFNTQNNESLVVLHIEVDEFKELFIRIGRTSTERILDKVANVICSEIDADGSVARVGLSSFSASQPDTDSDQGILIARRIGKAISNFRVKLKGRVLPVSVSSGICRSTRVPPQTRRWYWK
ncbi:MAG TPA: diguanylate cyclase [Gammaproteobacteria bacterium]|nr:diguanylate cyclase [Gammaproteobacteria bacterium]